MQDKTTTDFGYEEIPASEKQDRVGAVFTSVAEKYDLMNNVMSFGVRRTPFMETIYPGNVWFATWAPRTRPCRRHWRPGLKTGRYGWRIR